MSSRNANRIPAFCLDQAEDKVNYQTSEPHMWKNVKSVHSFASVQYRKHCHTFLVLKTITFHKERLFLIPPR
jgi:hypothetical protein